MVKFTEEELAQLVRNQEEANRDVLKPKATGKGKNIWRGGSRPKVDAPEPECVYDKDGRELNICLACGARWDDSATCSHATKNKRQFTTGGVDMFHCFCKPLRSFERYKK